MEATKFNPIFDLEEFELFPFQTNPFFKKQVFPNAPFIKTEFIPELYSEEMMNGTFVHPLTLSTPKSDVKSETLMTSSPGQEEFSSPSQSSDEPSENEEDRYVPEEEDEENEEDYEDEEYEEDEQVKMDKPSSRKRKSSPSISFASSGPSPKKRKDGLNEFPILKQPKPFCTVGKNRACKVKTDIPVDLVQEIRVTPCTEDHRQPLPGFLQSVCISSEEIRVTFNGMKLLRKMCQNNKIEFKTNMSVCLLITHPDYRPCYTRPIKLLSKTVSKSDHHLYEDDAPSSPQISKKRRNDLAD